jgi:hypothetical protein
VEPLVRRSPGIVLDTAALLAYASGDLKVGEIVALLADRGETVVIPAACLATAYRDVDAKGSTILDLLANLEHALVAPLTRKHCAVAGGWSRILGLDTAHAAIEAASNPVTPLMTEHRSLVIRFLPKAWPIVDV